MYKPLKIQAFCACFLLFAGSSAYAQQASPPPAGEERYCTLGIDCPPPPPKVDPCEKGQCGISSGKRRSRKAFGSKKKKRLSSFGKGFYGARGNVFKAKVRHTGSARKRGKRRIKRTKVKKYSRRR